MPRAQHRQIIHRYKFNPQYKRESYLEYCKTIPITRAIDIQIQNYIAEMHEVFNNLMKLSQVEIDEYLTIPNRIKRHVKIKQKSSDLLKRMRERSGNNISK